MRPWVVVVAVRDDMMFCFMRKMHAQTSQPGVGEFEAYEAPRTPDASGYERNWARSVKSGHWLSVWVGVKHGVWETSTDAHVPTDRLRLAAMLILFRC